LLRTRLIFAIVFFINILLIRSGASLSAASDTKRKETSKATHHNYSSLLLTCNLHCRDVLALCGLFYQESIIGLRVKRKRLGHNTSNGKRNEIVGVLDAPWVESTVDLDEKLSLHAIPWF
jgi:hypothetical protein